MSELVDYERAWLHLKAYVGSKRSHGIKDLQGEMARLEVESMYPEDGRPRPDHAAPTDTGQLDSAAGDAPAEPTSGDQPTTPEEASWTPTHPPVSKTTPPDRSPAASVA